MYAQQAARLATHRCLCGENAVAWEYSCPRCLIRQGRIWYDRSGWPYDALRVPSSPSRAGYLAAAPRKDAVSSQGGGAGTGTPATHKAGAIP